MTNNQVTNKLILEMMSKRFDRLEASFDKHCETMDTRVSTLEKFRDRIYFVGAIAGTAASVAYDYIKSKFFSK